METSSSFLQLQDNHALQKLPYQSYSTSDAGYHSAGGSLSPSSSIDSCGFSPPAYFQGGSQEESQIFQMYLGQENSEEKLPKRTGRPRSKFPGVKRQTASEREKLRMRDQTKALHHLRRFLPPSVAPASKVLTKIETLRLTIQYISCLSAQLGLSESPGDAGRQAEDNDASAVFEEFSSAPSVSQSLEAQETTVMAFYQMQNAVLSDFPSVSAQQFWGSQQLSFGQR